MKNRKHKNTFNTGGEPFRRFSDHETIFSWRWTLAVLAIIVVTSCATSRVERERLQLVQYPKIDALFQQLSTMDQEDDANTELSIQRAMEVADFLHEAGDIPKARIESEGRGESEPVASNDTEEGRAKNRRIEVTILNVANIPYNPATH